MVPDESPIDTEVTARDRLRHELLTSLTVIATRTDLLRRQVLRADGLTPVERGQILASLAAAKGAAERLHEQLEALLRVVPLAGLPEVAPAAQEPPDEPSSPEPAGRA